MPEHQRWGDGTPIQRHDVADPWGVDPHERWVRVMAKISSGGLWDVSGCARHPDDLPVTPTLIARIACWQAWHDELHHANTPFPNPFYWDQRSDAPLASFNAEERAIGRALKAELPARADGGVDGIIYFKPDGKRTEKAIVSVKGGDNVGVQMIRDLHSAMEREKAPIGVFITKVLPTTPMLKEAAAVGRFHSEATGKSYPRLQILTLAELFQGKRPDIPYVDATAAFKRAACESSARQAQLL